MVFVSCQVWRGANNSLRTLNEIASSVCKYRPLLCALRCLKGECMCMCVCMCECMCVCVCVCVYIYVCVCVHNMLCVCVCHAHVCVVCMCVRK